MEASPALEPQLHAEIDQLRTQFPRTQELYREVCVMLFFRHGITPTANRLYQLVKKGSMSAPAEALTRFWATLREKSRVRIEHPDLPAELQFATGELAAALWTRAVGMAQDQLAVGTQLVQFRGEVTSSGFQRPLQLLLALLRKAQLVLQRGCSC